MFAIRGHLSSVGEAETVLSLGDEMLTRSYAVVDRLSVLLEEEEAAHLPSSLMAVIAYLSGTVGEGLVSLAGVSESSMATGALIYEETSETSVRPTIQNGAIVEMKTHGEDRVVILVTEGAEEAMNRAFLVDQLVDHRLTQIQEVLHPWCTEVVGVLESGLMTSDRETDPLVDLDGLLVVRLGVIFVPPEILRCMQVEGTMSRAGVVETLMAEAGGFSAHEEVQV